MLTSVPPQLCWTKFCSFFEVEPRFLPIKESCRTLHPDAVAEAIDENTIGVVAILGSTYTAEMDDVKGIDAVIGDHLSLMSAHVYIYNRQAARC
jgi:glutamate decarboxylase